MRKTAAIGVLKLYAANPRMAEEHSLVGNLKEMLQDSSPMVVSNTVVALNEIHMLAEVCSMR